MERDRFARLSFFQQHLIRWDYRADKEIVAVRCCSLLKILLETLLLVITMAAISAPSRLVALAINSDQGGWLFLIILALLLDSPLLLYVGAWGLAVALCVEVGYHSFFIELRKLGVHQDGLFLAQGREL